MGSRTAVTRVSIVVILWASKYRASTIRGVKSLVARMRSWWLTLTTEEAGSVWLTWSMRSLDPSSVLASSTRSALARGRATQIARLETASARTSSESTMTAASQGYVTATRTHLTLRKSIAATIQTTML